MKTIRIIICPECGNEVEEICTLDNQGRIAENHAFCADSGGGDCLWGGAWPNNSRNAKNNEIREQRKLLEKMKFNEIAGSKYAGY